MRFWVLLWVLGWRLRWLGRHHEDFQNKIRGKDFILQFRTVSGKVARYYHVTTDGVLAYPGLHEKPVVTLEFKDAAYAFSIILEAAKKPSVLMSAMQSQGVKANGDLSLMMWFVSIVKYLKPAKKNTEK